MISTESACLNDWSLLRKAVEVPRARARRSRKEYRDGVEITVYRLTARRPRTDCQEIVDITTRSSTVFHVSNDTHSRKEFTGMFSHGGAPGNAFAKRWHDESQASSIFRICSVYFTAP